jgi:parallel beta-helix repeat protein
LSKPDHLRQQRQSYDPGHERLKPGISFDILWWGDSATAERERQHVHQLRDPSDDHASKFDNYGGGTTPYYASFTDNMTTFLYVRGSSVSVANNTLFSNSAGIYLDYDGTNGIPSDGLLIGTNNWLNGGTLTAGANPGLFTNNHLAAQLTAGTITYVNVANFATRGIQ